MGMAEGLEAFEDGFDAVFAGTFEVFGDGGWVGGGGEGFEDGADGANLIGEGFLFPVLGSSFFSFGLALSWSKRPERLRRHFRVRSELTPVSPPGRRLSAVLIFRVRASRDPPASRECGTTA